jgi:uncharacterized protein (DUF2237 family)
MAGTAFNVLGGVLALCCTDPMTGFHRDGFCHTGDADVGRHTVCAQVTDAFLTFTRDKGNDLITPRPTYNFPGLKAGYKWCLCALRWREAYEAGVAPSIILEATHHKTLQFIPLEILQQFAVQP